MKKIIVLFFAAICILSCKGKEEVVDESFVTILFRSDPAFKGGRMEGVAPDWDVMQDIVAREMPGTTLKFRPIQAPEGEYFTKVALALRTDPEYDIISEDSFMLQSDAAAGYLAPLDVENWEDWEQFYKGGKDASTIDGKVYTIPWNTDVRGIWYSRALFSEAGLPDDWQAKNWNDILDAARKIKALNKDVVPFMIYLSRANGEATTMQTFLMLLYGTEDKLFEDGKWIVESKGMLDTLTFIQTLRDENLIVPDDILLTTAYGGYMEPYAISGNVGLRLDGSWMASGFEAAGVDNWREIYGFSGMPTEFGNPERPLITFQGGFGFSISAISKKKEKAWEVIKIITSYEALNEIYKTSGHISTRADVGETPEHQAMGVNAQGSTFLPYGNYRPANEDYPAVSAEIQAMVESVITGQTPEKAMTTFAKNVEAIVGSEKIIKKN